MAYLSVHANRLAIATLSRRRTVIGLAHQRQGYPSPTEDPAVREVWAGIRRSTPARGKAKTALWTSDLARLLAAIPCDGAIDEPGVLLGIRDRALLLLGYAGALRRSELAALDLEDVRDDPRGLIVLIRTSKTDQEGAGGEVGIPFASQPELCPVHAVDRWRDALRQRLGILEEHFDGALFRPIARHGRVGAPRAGNGAASQLTPAAVRLIVKRRCAAAGIDPKDYAAHSLRSGFATQASANGAAERDVMRHGRWRSVTVARGYVQRGTLFTDNAAGRLGL